MKQITGGITAAKGFQAAGIEAGIKYQNRKDMAIIYSEKPCVAAGTFTSNVVKAAPVKWDRKLLEESPYVQAVIVNTGIANAGTGAEGMKLCEETAKEASGCLAFRKMPYSSDPQVSSGRSSPLTGSRQESADLPRRRTIP